MPACVHVCVYVCRCALCMYVPVEARSQHLVLSFIALYIIFQANVSSLKLELSDYPDWLVHKLRESACFHSMVLGLQECAETPRFFCG